jgi:hypothetical protein
LARQAGGLNFRLPDFFRHKIVPWSGCKAPNQQVAVEQNTSHHIVEVVPGGKEFQLPASVSIS